MSTATTTRSSAIASLRGGRAWAAGSRPLRWGLLLSLAAIGLTVAVRFGWHTGKSLDHLVTYRVEPRDLPITVIERGHLESQTNIQVLCEVDDYRSDGILGTPIVWVIPNGTSVQEGDLICELDSTAIQSELDEQILDTEEARSAYIQAEANLENQKIQNATAEDKARLDVELARLELQMFQDQEKGSHKLAMEAIQRQIDDLNNEILAAEMNLKLRRNEKTGIESLFKLGYAGKSELDRSVLSYLQAEGDYAAKLNRLQTQLATLEKMETFDKQMQQLELEGRLRTAEQNLKQVIVTNKAKLAQMEGLLKSRTEQLKKEEERLERYRSQLAKCKIYAPQDGMVAYASPQSSRDAEIAEGVPVRPRQHILSIPNLKRMQVETAVHESVLDRVQPGLKVDVTVDAFPDRRYEGTVKSVAVLPERSYYSDTKTYKTIVTIDEEVYQLKPGMTAVCEIKVDYIPDVLTVPIQAIVQRAGENWVYVRSGSNVQRRSVELGASNDQHVIVTNGLRTGDLVVLNPGAILGDSQDESSTDEQAPEGPDAPEGLVATVSSSSALQ
ncbi:MAG: efflux RND transporter periplasmic adaptor subunit [Planctomycetota bacterium]|nr:MAG: efflux RND transporter periplasmic adaptor subunit [Planctomycetota bacterium]